MFLDMADAVQMGVRFIYAGFTDGQWQAYQCSRYLEERPRANKELSGGGMR